MPGEKESHLRSLLKGLSWRITATTSTMIIAWIITGSTAVALTIGGIEAAAKIFIYYLHERLWLRITWGQPAPAGSGSVPSSGRWQAATD